MQTRSPQPLPTAPRLTAAPAHSYNLRVPADLSCLLCPPGCSAQAHGMTGRTGTGDFRSHPAAAQTLRSNTPSMIRNLSLVAALSAGLSVTPMFAQATAPASAPASQTAAPAATGAPSAPQAIPAKVALIAFENAVFATNEGQRAVQDVQKKYEPKKTQIDSLSGEVDTLKKQLQGAPATLSDEERQNRLKAIDTKEKQLNRDAEDAQQAYNADLQEAYGKVAQKVAQTAKQYCAQSGFTLLLDVSNQASNVMWASQSTEVTQAVVEAYNKSSGITAPPPSAPSAARPATNTRPAGTGTPRAPMTPR